MTDSSSSEIEVELYEEVINMNYSTPVASRASSPLSHDKNESSMTRFNGPMVSSSESEVQCSSVGVRPRTDRHTDARDHNTFCVVYNSRKM